MDELSALFGFQPVDFVGSVCRTDPEVPKPEDSDQDYTIEVLKIRKHYAAKLKKRNLSPASKAFATLYESAVMTCHPIYRRSDNFKRGPTKGLLGRLQCRHSDSDDAFTDIHTDQAYREASHDDATTKTT